MGPSPSPGCKREYLDAYKTRICPMGLSVVDFKYAAHTSVGKVNRSLRCLMLKKFIKENERIISIRSILMLPSIL